MCLLTARYVKMLLIFSFVAAIYPAYGFHHGIYLTQSTAENAGKLSHFIQQAKAHHIDTFVIDVTRTNSRYANHIKKVIANGIHYVARVVVFPHGGTEAQVRDKKIWSKRLALAKYAESLGASAIQLDYIRYNVKSHSSREKGKRILEVVKYFRNNLRVQLQLDIFGVAAHKPSHTIGQNVSLLAPVVDAFCPMVYPSHYEPYRYHAVRPYQTVFNSVSALKSQLKSYSGVKIYAYIEVYNYRYPLSWSQKLKYISDQMKGAKDAGADGWYVWSPQNRYGALFQVLR